MHCVLFRTSFELGLNHFFGNTPHTHTHIHLAALQKGARIPNMLHARHSSSHVCRAAPGCMHVQLVAPLHGGTVEAVPEADDDIA